MLISATVRKCMLDFYPEFRLISLLEGEVITVQMVNLLSNILSCFSRFNEVVCEEDLEKKRKKPSYMSAANIFNGEKIL